MNDVYIEFEGTGREGTVAVGTYLFDAAKRLGVNLACECTEDQPSNACAVRVLKGEALLSPVTNSEIEQLGASERKDSQRLSCQTKIEKPGELVVMTVKKEEKKETASKEKNGSDDYKKEFQEMPLDEKIASLVELEAIALGETISFVINSPYKAFGKVMDVMAGFGLQKEQQDKEAKVPEEHKEGEDTSKGGKGKKAAKESATEGHDKPSKSPAAGEGRKKKKKKNEQEDTE